MPDPTTLLLFAGAALALLVVPGPSVVYIVTRGIHQGRAAALVSVLGVTTATLVHTVFAAAGLSAILASSALAFSIGSTPAPPTSSTWRCGPGSTAPMSSWTAFVPRPTSAGSTRKASSSTC